MSRTRVLMLTFEYDAIRCGGLATCLTALCGALDLERFEPVVVLPRSSHALPWRRVAHHSLPHCEAEVYRERGCELWLLSNPLLDGPIYPEPPESAGIKKIDEYSERVYELLERLRVDVVHLHDAFGYKCLHAARGLGVPSVLTIHRLHEDEPTFAFAELAAARLADAVTTVSHSYLQERRDFFGACARVEAIPNGLAPGFWSEALLPPTPGGRPERLRALLGRLGLPPGPTFAYAGRLDSVQKGLDVLLDAHARELSHEPLNLLFVGEGDPALTERITLATRRAPGGNLRFIPRMLPKEEVRALLGAVDAVVIPSRFEPFGLVQLEAMAMGALPIASRVGGLRDVILDWDEEGGFGRLFEPGDVGALAAAMRRLMALPPEQVERARRAARAQAEVWSARTMAASYERLYDSLLDARSGQALRHAS